MKFCARRFLLLSIGLAVAATAFAQNTPTSRSPGTENESPLQTPKEFSARKKQSKKNLLPTRENAYVGLSFGGTVAPVNGYARWLGQNQYADDWRRPARYDASLQTWVHLWKGSPSFIGLDIGYSFDGHSSTRYETTRVGFIFGKMIPTRFVNRRMAFALSATYSATTWRFEGEPQLPFNLGQSDDFSMWNGNLCLSPSLKMFRVLPFRLHGDANAFTTGLEIGTRIRMFQQWYYRDENTKDKNHTLNNIPALTRVDLFVHIPFGWFWRDSAL